MSTMAEVTITRSPSGSRNGETSHGRIRDGEEPELASQRAARKLFGQGAALTGGTRVAPGIELCTVTGRNRRWRGAGDGFPVLGEVIVRWPAPCPACGRPVGAASCCDRCGWTIDHDPLADLRWRR